MESPIDRTTEQRLDNIEKSLSEALRLLRALEQRLDRMPTALDALDALRPGGVAGVAGALHDLTPAQHVALQMILGGRSDREIAECLGGGEESVRQLVRDMAIRLGVKGRAEVAARARPVLRAMSADEYLRASGGLPKDWNDKYGVGGIPDPFRAIYHAGSEDTPGPDGTLPTES